MLNILTNKSQDETNEIDPSLDQGLVFETLEPRILLSADLAGALAQVTTPEDALLTTAVEEQIIEDISDHSSTQNTNTTEPLIEIAFIDDSAENYQQLIDDLEQTNPSIFIFTLDSEKSGLDQIQKALENYQNIDAIHFVTHGNDGQIKLGNTLLQSNNLHNFEADLIKIGEHLNKNSDLLFYGCDVAETSEGRSLLDQISKWTKADIAASDDLTGNASFNADWDLEYQTGAIEAEIAFSQELQSNWSGLLATLTVDTTTDENDGDTSSISNLIATPGGSGISLREAIIAANNTAGNDTITLSANTYTLSISSDLDVSSNITINGVNMSSTTIDANGNNRLFNVFSSGTLNLNDLAITGGGNGGSTNTGGAIEINTGSTVNLSSVDVYGNSTNNQAGGAIHNLGTFTATDSLFRNNTSGNNEGGALFNQGTMVLTRTSVINNTAASGAGIQQSGSNLTLINVTVSGNQSQFDGAGLLVNGSGTTTISFSTFANNNTLSSGNGGGIHRSSATVNISNSIFADNSSQFGGADLNGAITSNGYNIVEDYSGFTPDSIGLDADITGVDPSLSTLALDATSGQYVHAITTSSNAKNSGGGSAPTTDQRGFTRDSSPDIGAFELASLLGHWTFDADATDSSGNGYDGTLQGDAAIDTTDATDIVGAGKLSLDGTGDYVDLSAYVANFSGLTEGTIAGWIQTTGIQQVIFSISDTADSNSYVTLYAGGLGYLTFDVFENNSPSLSVYNGNGPAINDGAWHHVAVTMSASGSFFYLDGQKISASDLIYDVGTASTQAFFNNVSGLDAMSIGNNQNSSGGRWFTNGLLDEVRVYDRVLSPGDISELFASSDNTPADLPVNLVPGAQNVDEDSVLTFSSGNGNAVTVSDANAGTNVILQVVLSINDGILTLSQTTGLTISGSGDGTASMTIEGTESDINAALEGMTFTADANFNGAVSLDIETSLTADPATTNLETQITFDDGTADDQSGGTARDGTLTNGALIIVDPERGNVLSLDGVDDSVVISPRITDSNTITLSAWINIDSPTGNHEKVISLSNNYILGLRPDGTVFADYRRAGGWNSTFSVSNVTASGWRHLTYTVDNANNVQRLYIDGVLEAETNYSDSNTFANQNDVIGRNGAGDSDNFTGLIDDVNIFTRALDGSEVALLAKASDADSIAITVTAVNDDPTNAGSLPTDIAVTEDVSSNVDLSVIDLSDADAGSSSLTVTLTTSTGGNLSAAAGTGITLGGTSTARTLTGNLTDLNNYLNTASNITYLHGTANLNGNNADTIQVNVNDNGNTGTGGGTDIDFGTVNVDITAVNDAPAINAVVLDGTAFYDFENGSASTLPGDPVLTVSAPVTIDAGAGQAGSTGLHFSTDADSSTHPVSLVNIPGVAVSGEFSFTAWVSFDAGVRAHERIFDFGGGSFNNNILLSRGSITNDLYLEVLSGGVSQGALTITNALSGIAGTFTHFGATFDSASSIGKIFINGVEVGSTTFAGSPDFTTWTNLYIGSSNWSVDRQFEGVMDEIGLYDRILTDAEMAISASVTSTLNNAVQYTENGTAVVLSAGTDVTDSELDAFNSGNGNYDGASVTLVRNGGVNTEDVFSFNDGNGITLVGSNLIKNSQTIATFNLTTTPGELVITWTDANGPMPTSADVDNILRQITYANSSDTPPTSAQIDWTFDDGNTGAQGTGGALTALGSTTVSITATNDAPVANPDSYILQEDGSLTTALLQTFGAEQIISSNGNGESNAAAVDLDGDGDLDIVTADSGELVWFENTDGRGTFGPRILISNVPSGTTAVIGADIDGDGDMDIVEVSLYDDTVGWLENIDGLGTFGSRQVITNAADAPRSVMAVDIDNDGDLDILVASNNDHTVAWFENTDGLGGFGSEQVITNTASWAWSARAADLDGDGDLDVLVASPLDDTVAWYENTDGLGTFGSEQVITNVANGAKSVRVADFDGDGDLDVVAASREDDTVAWYENIDGLGAFGTEQIITNVSDGAQYVDAADIDGDGDIDVLVIGQNDDTVAWFENTDGLGTFGPEQVISTTADYGLSVITADLDGDGDLDVLITSRDDNTVSWFENKNAGVQINDSDVDGDPLTAVLVTDVSNGTLVLNANGTFTYTPDPDFNGVDSFTYKANDGTTDSNTVTVTLNVTAVNDAPVVVMGGPYTIDEGDVFSFSAAGSTDPDGDTLTYAWDLDNDGQYDDAPISGGGITWGVLGLFGIVDDGVYTLGIQVDDGNGGITTDSTTLTINNVAPTLTATGNATASGGGTYTLNLSDIDPGDDTITSWTVNWGDGTITTHAGDPTSVTHTYSNDLTGLTLDITVSATDEDGTHFDADVLVPSYAGSDSVHRYDGSTGEFLGLIGSLADGLDDLVAIITGPNGNFFISAISSDNILEYQPNGTLVGTFVSAGSGGLSQAAGIAFGPDGNLYVASGGTDQILRFDGTTGAFIDVFVAAGTGGLDFPLGITFGADGDLYSTSRGTNGVLRFDGITGVLDTGFVSGSAGAAEDITIGPDGNVYVADYYAGVQRYNGTTGSYIDTFVSVGSGGLLSAAGIAFGPDGNLYIGDQDGDAVRRYNGTTGAYIDDYVASGVGGLDGTAYLSFEADHQVTIVNTNIGPSVATNTGATFIEGSAANTITTAMLEEGDPDDAGTELTYTITTDVTNGTLKLSGSLIGLNDTFTQADIDANLVIYDHNGSETTSDIFTFSLADGGENGATPATGTFNITITAINDDPTNAGSLPSDISVTEDVASNVDLSLINLSDVDHGGGNLTITLTTSTGGVLTAASGGGIIFGNNGSSNITLNGTLANLNTYLNTTSNITYLHGTANLNGNNADTIQVDISDNGNTGSGGGGTINFGTVNIDIAAAGDAPVVSVPGGQNINEDLILTFSSGNGNAITVSDGTNSNGRLQVSLSVNNGVLKLSQLTGLSIPGGADNSSFMTLHGTESDINAALEGLTFTPTSNYNGSASLQITTTLAADLVGYYTFDAGNAVDDSVGISQDGTIQGNGTVVTDGIRGQVLQLDGTAGTYVQIGGQFGSPPNITLSAWVNSTNAYMDVITVGQGLNLRFDDPNDSGTRGISAIYNDGSTTFVTPSGQFISGTGWHHIALTFDDASKQMSLYLDGEVIAEQTFANSIDYGSIDSFIGSNQGGGLFFDGKIDDARIYSRALSADEIASLAAELVSDSDSISITINPINDAPVVTVPGSALSASEQVGLTVHGTGFGVSDVDEANGGSTATINVGEGNITVVTGNSGVIISSGNGSGTVALSGTISQINNLLTGGGTGTITYLNNSDTPSASTTITITVNDQGNTGTDPGLSGDGTSEEGSNSQTINITAVNDEQVLATNTGTSVSEGSTGNVITTAMLETTDAEQATNQIIYTVDVVASNGTLYRNGVALGASDTFTQADIDSNLITYDHDGSQTSSDSFDFNVDDGTGTTTSATFTWTIGNVNDVPVQSLIESSALAYTENDGAVTITSTLTISDVDDANLESATVQITGNYTNAQDLLSFIDQNGISGSWNNGSGTITLTGTATVAQYQIALRSITYSNSSENPSTSTRTISFIVNDGDGNSNIVMRNIAIASVNDAPILTGASSVTRPEGTGHVPFNGSTVSDVDSADFDGGTLTFADASSIDPTDTFNIVATGGVSTSGANVLVSGLTVASYTGGTGGASLVITFNSNATLVRVQSVYQAVAIGNYTQNPVTGTRNIEAILTDGDSGTSNTATAAVTITAVNDDPTNAGSLPSDITVTENVASNVNLSAIDLIDVDAGTSSLTVTLTTSTGGNLTAAAGTGISVGGTSTALTLTGNLTYLNNYLDTASNITYLHGTANLNGNNADTIQVSVSDNGNSGSGGGSTINFGTVNVDITSVNDLPTATNKTISTNEDTTYTFTAADFNYSDLDGDTLASIQITTLETIGALQLSGVDVTLNQVISKANIDAGNLKFVPVTNANGSNYDSFAFSVNDGTANSANRYVMTINITAINDAPATTGITDIVVNEDAANSVIDLSSAFSDQESVLTYSITSNTNSSLFNSILINNSVGTMTLDYAADQNGVATITIRATDSGGLFIETTFTITVNAVNDAPVAADDSASVENGGSVNINLISNDSDAENAFDLNSITILTNPAHGTLVDYGDGTIGYFHDGSEISTDSFSYTISDNNGAISNVVTVSITITNNIIPIDPPTLPPEIPPEENEETPEKDKPSKEIDEENLPAEPNQPSPVDEEIQNKKPEADDIDQIDIFTPELQPNILIADSDDVVSFDHSENEVLEKFIKGSLRNTVSTQQESRQDEYFSFEKTSFSIDPGLLNELKKMGQEISEEADQQAYKELIFERTAEVGGVVLFAGFVKWLLQASSLAASLLGALPAWRWMDPIPVLIHADEDKEENKVKKSWDLSKTIKQLINKFRSPSRDKDVNNA